MSNKSAVPVPWTVQDYADGTVYIYDAKNSAVARIQGDDKNQKAAQIVTAVNSVGPMRSCLRKLVKCL